MIENAALKLWLFTLRLCKKMSSVLYDHIFRNNRIMWTKKIRSEQDDINDKEGKKTISSSEKMCAISCCSESVAMAAEISIYACNISLCS